MVRILLGVSGMIKAITAYIEEGKWRGRGEMSLKIYNALGWLYQCLGNCLTIDRSVRQGDVSVLRRFVS